MKHKLLVILLGLVFCGMLYWYFIGIAPLTIRVNETMPNPAPGEEMIVLKQGEFTAIDTIHKGSGTAKIVKSDEKYFLILENFHVTNGPDLYVYLSKNKEITNERALGEFKEIMQLKGNEGNQVYEITKENAENFSSIVIWCKRFGVLFSSATLV